MTARLSRVFLLACLLASPAAFAQTYPDRNVTIVVTSAAGALTDVLTRAVAQQLSEKWTQGIAETVPGYEASVSFGLFAPAGTPADIVKKLNADVEQIVSDPGFQKKYLERFAVQPVPASLAAFADYLRKDSAKWVEVIKKSGVTIE